MALVLQARKQVAVSGAASPPAAISLTSGWATGAGGANYTPVAGDTIYVSYVIGTTAVDVDVAMTTSGYSELTELFSNDSAATNLAVFRKRLSGTPDTTVQVGATTNAAYGGAINISVWSGVDPTNPEDVTVTTATGINGAQPNPPAITPVTTGAMVEVIGGGAATTGAVFTQSGSELSNFLSTNSPDTTDAIIGAGHFAWTSGTFDPVVWTGGVVATAPSWAAVCIAIRPEATAPVMAADVGSYSIGGVAAGLAKGRTMAADPGSYSVTGVAATLTKTGLNNYSMIAEGFSPELVPDGGFDSATGWNIGANWAVTGGIADASGASNTEVSRAGNFSPETGAKYTYRFMVANRTVGTVGIRLGGLSTGSTNANGLRSSSTNATSTDSTVGVFGSSGFDGDVDDLSVRRVDYIIRGENVSFSKGRTMVAERFSPELNPDPTMDNAGAWDINAGWAVTGGKGVATAANSLLRVIGLTITDFAVHEYSFDVVAYTSGNVRARVGGVPSIDYNTTGTKTGTIVSSTVNDVGYSGDTFTGEVDNLSVRRVDYAYIGEAVLFNRGLSMPAAPGSYAITGTATGVLRNRLVSADVGSYVVTGVAATFSITQPSKTMVADPGAYTITGQTVGLLFGRSMVAVTGSYAISGVATDLEKGFAVIADPGAYVLTGQTVDFPYTQVIVANPGAYVLTGQAAILNFGKIQTADPGSYVISGQPADFIRGRIMVANVGSYAIAGVAAILHSGRTITVTPGSYSISGTSVGFLRLSSLIALTGSYVISGQAAVFSLGTVLDNVVPSLEPVIFQHQEAEIVRVPKLNRVARNLLNLSPAMTRDDLAASEPGVRFLYARGREGPFAFVDADLTAYVDTDVYEGVFIAPQSDPSGASGAWVRMFSGPAAFSWWGGEEADLNGPIFTAALATLNMLENDVLFVRNLEFYGPSGFGTISIQWIGNDLACTFDNSILPGNMPFYITSDSTSALIGPRRLNFPNGYGIGDRKVLPGTEAPTSGPYTVGDYVHNIAPTAGSPLGWRCVTAGAPGTWEAVYPRGISPVTIQNGTSYTAGPGDAETYIRFTNGSPVTFIIPPNSSVAYPVGTVIEIEQAGPGPVTIAPGAGVILQSRGGDFTLAGQYSVAAAKQVDIDEWTVVGDL